MLNLDRTDNKKPPLEGITSIIDKLQPLGIENVKTIVSYVDSVKIPQSCFLLYSPAELERRIKFYYEHNISVAIDSKIKLLIMHLQIILLMNTFVSYCHLDLIL